MDRKYTVVEEIRAVSELPPDGLTGAGANVGLVGGRIGGEGNVGLVGVGADGAPRQVAWAPFSSVYLQSQLNESPTNVVYVKVWPSLAQTTPSLAEN